MSPAAPERSGGEAAAGGDWYVTAFADAYPLLYRHRDDAEARRCLDLLPRLASLGSGPVLDLGCGAGRHLVELAQRGVTALGLDLSPVLLRAAAERRAAAADFALVRGDMRALPLATGRMTAVLSLFTAFGYFDREREHAAVVAEVARVLRTGGHWYLDYLAADRVRAELTAGPAERREREVGPLRVRERRRLATRPERVIKEVELQPLPGREGAAAAFGVPASGRRYRERVRLFTLEELDGFAAAVGLLRVAAAGGYDGRPLGSPGADRWILVYRRAAGTAGGAQPHDPQERSA